jgi:hypothetical protein
MILERILPSNFPAARVISVLTHMGKTLKQRIPFPQKWGFLG